VNLFRRISKPWQLLEIGHKQQTQVWQSGLDLIYIKQQRRGLDEKIIQHVNSFLML